MPSFIDSLKISTWTKQYENMMEIILKNQIYTNNLIGITNAVLYVFIIIQMYIMGYLT